MLEICTQVAMVGALVGRHDEAGKILQALDLFLPQSLKVGLASAYCQTMLGAVDDATTLLRERVIPFHPDSDFAVAFLNFIEAISEKTENMDGLEALLESESETEVLFAEGALDVVDAMRAKKR
jgi:hypothetical protein